MDVKLKKEKMKERTDLLALSQMIYEFKDLIALIYSFNTILPCI